MAQVAAFKEVAESKLRGLLAYRKTFRCAGVKMSDSALSYEAPERESAPKIRNWMRRNISGRFDP